MTSVVISQPMYFPWPGFIEHMATADVFIWLDDAQFSKGSFTNRIQVKLDNGRKWMSVPLDGKGTMTPINKLAPSNQDWPASHRAMLSQSFRAAPSKSLALDIFDRAMSRSSLLDALIASAEEIAKVTGALPDKILRSSDMGVDGDSWQRVLSLVKKVGGTRYITGHGAARYLDHQHCENQGVSVDYLDYSLTPWPQPFGDFTPYVTALDLIAATGSEARTFLHPRTIPWRDFLSRSEAHDESQD